MDLGNSLGIASNDGRATPGIYFLWRAGRVVYVGQAKCVLSRAAEHCMDKEFDSSTYVAFADEDLSFAESYYIWFLNPPLNRAIPILGKQWSGHAGSVAPQTITTICEFLRRLPADVVESRFRDAEVRGQLWQGQPETLFRIEKLNRNIERRVLRRANVEATDGAAQG